MLAKQFKWDRDETSTSCLHFNFGPLKLFRLKRGNGVKPGSEVRMRFCFVDVFRFLPSGEQGNQCFLRVGQSFFLVGDHAVGFERGLNQLFISSVTFEKVAAVVCKLPLLLN